MTDSCEGFPRSLQTIPESDYFRVCPVAEELHSSTSVSSNEADGLFSPSKHNLVITPNSVFEDEDDELTSKTACTIEDFHSEIESAIYGTKAQHSAATSVSNLDIIRKVGSVGCLSLSSSAGYQQDQLFDFTSNDALRNQRRKLCVEEFIATEESYLSGLRLLVNTYFATLPSSNEGVDDESEDIRRSGAALVDFHQKILSSIYAAYPGLYAPSAAYSAFILPILPSSIASFDDHVGSNRESCRTSWTQSTLLVSSPMVAATVAQVVEREVSNLFVYEQYCLNYNSIIGVLKDYRDSTSLPLRRWSKGCEILAQASQPSMRHRDVSLDALAANPTVRIMRYRLLIQELLKLTQPTDSVEAHEMLLASLDSISKSLNRLDKEYGIQQMRLNSVVLCKRFTFEQPIGFDPQFLGCASLCGALHISWIDKGGSFWSACAGVFLFKSYLVLANLSKPDNYTVRFLISLGSTKLVEPDDNVGMQTSCPYSFKLVTECNFGLYEILMTAVSVREKEVWREQLQTQICANNGGDQYSWDYEASITSARNLSAGTSAFVPSHMRQLSVMEQGPTTPTVRSPRRIFSSRFLRHNQQCLSERVDVAVDHFASECTTDPDSLRRTSVPPLLAHSQETAATCPDSVTSNRRSVSTSASPVSGYHRASLRMLSTYDKRQPPRFVQHVRRAERIQVETLIGQIWSYDMLPRTPVTQMARTQSRLSLGTKRLVRRISSVGGFNPSFARKQTTGSATRGPPTYQDTTADETPFDDSELEDALRIVKRDGKIVVPSPRSEQQSPLVNKKNRRDGSKNMHVLSVNQRISSIIRNGF
ncbi:hypothetical protein V1512DRAFT_200257 [Lipomyces arxii]|uniref:uncharacterized protein n=1 Tax=Lipomyces arxii TaxID=56418 RepID=UPI0034CE72F0